MVYKGHAQEYTGIVRGNLQVHLHRCSNTAGREASGSSLGDQRLSEQLQYCAAMFEEDQVVCTNELHEDVDEVKLQGVLVLTSVYISCFYCRSRFFKTLIRSRIMAL